MQPIILLLLALIYIISFAVNWYIGYRALPRDSFNKWTILILLLSPLTAIFTLGSYLHEKDIECAQHKVSHVVDPETNITYAWATYEEFLRFALHIYTAELLREKKQNFNAWSIHSWAQWEPYVQSLVEDGAIIYTEFPDAGCIVLQWKE